MGLLVALAGLFAAMLGQSPAPATGRFAVGQTWTFLVRPREPEAMLRIHRIEPDAAGHLIYHIGVVGYRTPNGAPVEIAHLPVSEATLVQSVRAQPDPRIAATLRFLSPDEGIAEWRRAKGGVFTQSMAGVLATIADAIDGPGAAVH